METRRSQHRTPAPHSQGPRPGGAARRPRCAAAGRGSRALRAEDPGARLRRARSQRSRSRPRHRRCGARGLRRGQRCLRRVQGCPHQGHHRGQPASAYRREYESRLATRRRRGQGGSARRRGQRALRSCPRPQGVHRAHRRQRGRLSPFASASRQTSTGRSYGLPRWSPARCSCRPAEATTSSPLANTCPSATRSTIARAWSSF